MQDCGVKLRSGGRFPQWDLLAVNASAPPDQIQDGEVGRETARGGGGGLRTVKWRLERRLGGRGGGAVAFWQLGWGQLGSDETFPLSCTGLRARD